MDYLSQTLTYMQQENQQLRCKLKQMTDLQELVQQQRNHHSRQHLENLHQQQIAVIREIYQQKEQKIKVELKKMNKQNSEINLQLQQQIQQNMQNRVNFQQQKMRINELQQKIIQMTRQIENQKHQNQMLLQKHIKEDRRLEQNYKKREQKIIQNYMEKLSSLQDDQEEQLSTKDEQILYLNSRLSTMQRQKRMFEDQISQLASLLKTQQSKIHALNKKQETECDYLRKQNHQLMIKLQQKQIEIIKSAHIIQQKQLKIKKLEEQLLMLNKKYKNLEQNKKKELAKQQFKNKQTIKCLSQQQKYLKQNTQTQKKKERDYSNTSKILITKIKEIQSKYQFQKQKCLKQQKTATKTDKKGLSTYQSVSLDSSLYRQKDSPSVSCFIKDDFSEIKHKTKQLTIDTSAPLPQLHLKDLDTPCFQSGKDSVRKTIKLRK